MTLGPFCQIQVPNRCMAMGSERPLQACHALPRLSRSLQGLLSPGGSSGPAVQARLPLLPTQGSQRYLIFLGQGHIYCSHSNLFPSTFPSDSLLESADLPRTGEEPDLRGQSPCIIGHKRPFRWLKRCRRIWLLLWFSWQNHRREVICPGWVPILAL